MSLWKKAVGSAASASLLASLLLTVAAGSAAALACGTTTYGGVVTYTACPDNLTVPADGASTIVLTFVTGNNAATTTATVSTTAGKFIATDIAGVTIPAGGTTSFTAAAIAGGDVLTIAAPTTAGTGVVTISLTPIAGGAATPDSSTTVTFTAATGLTVNTSSSTTSVSPSSASATGGTSAISTLVYDAAGNALTSGLTVTYTLSGPCILASNNLQQNSDSTSAYGDTVNALGTAGACTVKTAVKLLGVTYNLADQTITFVGPLSTATLGQNRNSVVTDLASNQAGSAFAPSTAGDNRTGQPGGLLLTLKDAGGNKIKSGFTLSATVTPAFLATVDTAVGNGDSVYNSNLGAIIVPFTCNDTAGSGTIALTATVGTVQVTTNTVTINCVDALAATAQGTFTISAASPTVAPNGTDKISVTVKDDNGLPAADGTSVTVVTNGVGNVVNDAGAVAPGTTTNGVATFTFLAPANAASATVTAFVGNTTTGTAAVTLTIGAGAPSTGIFAPTTSALGNTLTGPFTFATKIQAKGGYITWKVDGGAALAGKTIQVWVYKKFSATGAWAGPTMLTTRVANASGVAYVNILSRGVLWLSLRPVLPASGTAVAVWGPTSIGRWR